MREFLQLLSLCMEAGARARTNTLTMPSRLSLLAKRPGSFSMSWVCKTDHTERPHLLQELDCILLWDGNRCHPKRVSRNWKGAWSSLHSDGDSSVYPTLFQNASLGSCHLEGGVCKPHVQVVHLSSWSRATPLTREVEASLSKCNSG